MGKSLSMLIEERRDLNTDLKALRRNRLYLQERIDECVKGIKKINRRIDEWRSPDEKIPEESVPEEKIPEEDDLPEDEDEEDVEEKEKPKRKYTPRKKVEEEEE